MAQHTEVLQRRQKYAQLNLLATGLSQPKAVLFGRNFSVHATSGNINPTESHVVLEIVSEMRQIPQRSPKHMIVARGNAPSPFIVHAISKKTSLVYFKIALTAQSLQFNINQLNPKRSIGNGMEELDHHFDKRQKFPNQAKLKFQIILIHL